MEKIASFQVNHLTLVPGVYFSRRDKVGSETLTTFDLRMTRPNKEPVMNTAEVHTLEHLGATFLRNHPVWKDRVIYFGPMGCRTGFYLILAGELEPMDIIDLLCEMYAFMAGFAGWLCRSAHGTEYRDTGCADAAQSARLAGRFLQQGQAG